MAENVRRVRGYRRTERGEWSEAPEIYRAGERFELPRLTQAIAVDEIYDSILDASGLSLLT